MIDHDVLQRHFRRVDPVLSKIVRQVGPVTLKLRRHRFQSLVQSILSQQISTSAARSIRKRLEERLKRDGIRPETVARLKVEEFRALGVSRQKAGYLHDLAAKCLDGTVRLPRLSRLSDEEIIDELIQVKGIGRWSAQMFLIFSLGRLDVFPPDDFGIRSAIRRLYDFAEMPNKAQCLEIGARWTPYASLGSWYCWRSLELTPKPPR